MPGKTDADYLRDMLEYAEKAQALAKGRTVQDLVADDMFRLAIQYCVLIIGEAASRVSDETRQKTPQIPWREIVGMRNWLVHGYSAIREQTLWDTVERDLSPLAEELMKIIPPEQT